MTTSLTVRQAVPMTGDERADLRDAASAVGATAGIFARALLRYAIDTVSDDELKERIAIEHSEAAQRRTRASLAGVLQRWPGRAETRAETQGGATHAE